MNDLSKIEKYILSNKDRITADLFKLCRIPSCSGSPEDGAPFGVEPANALKAAKDLYDATEAKSTLYPAYLLSEYGDGEKTIGIFSHADVVPAGEDWCFTAPFSPVMHGDYAIGRGVEDNKSGIVASLWAVKALSACDIKLKNKLMLFTGSNEENDMGDMDFFLKEQPMPQVSIVPDNEFPLCVGEKGIMHFDATAKASFSAPIEIICGRAYNIVPDSAVSYINMSDSLLKELKKSGTEYVNENGVLKLSAGGVSRHAAYPDGAVNALNKLLTLLSSIESFNENDKSILSSAAKISSGFHGEVFGIDSSDESFGALSCVCTVAKTVSGRLRLGFDIRYGNTFSGDEIKEKITSVLSGFGFDAENFSYSDGILNSENDPCAKALMDAYRNVTKDKDARAYISSGGTYARRLKNAYSIGTAAFPPPLPESMGSAHARDEAIHIPSFLNGIIILINMIIAVDGIL